ncbi:hypothetical protein B296_00020570 [Ensete ventricosum]|uniref:Uncharacterized protein n=1 Tax=Ensete ventricosum TaxID=4639 RepID=A0A426ZKZ5_ENSVE|nr:hypothetical protein B296_00020570 [Ensete ventricosum]
MTMEFGDDLLAIVGIALDGCGGLMDGCGRATRCQERCSNTNFGCCLGSRNRFDGTVIRLEGCPKDDVVDGSKIGRVLGVWEKKNDKGGCGGMMDDCGRIARCEEHCSDTKYGGRQYRPQKPPGSYDSGSIALRTKFNSVVVWIDSLQFRLLLVLRFEGVMGAGKGFSGSGLRLGRKNSSSMPRIMV